MLNKLRRKLKVWMRDAIMEAGIDLYKRSADRKMLEKKLLPHFSHNAAYPRVLFVGCDWYTRGYQKYFSSQDYWTLDFDGDKRRYGAAQHITDSITQLPQYFGPDSLDLIVCNGVFGYGLNERVDVDQAFLVCYQRLRAGGVLILGWNDIPERAPFDPLTALQQQGFKPHVLPGFNESRIRVPMRTRHVYDVVAK